jgi:hypothetical protein
LLPAKDFPEEILIVRYNIYWIEYFPLFERYKTKRNYNEKKCQHC